MSCPGTDDDHNDDTVHYIKDGRGASCSRKYRRGRDQGRYPSRYAAATELGCEMDAVVRLA